MAKKSVRKKHVPQRTCVGCREVLPKRTLIRIVKGTDGVQIDPSGKLAGRGAYLHDRRSCWEHGLKGALSKALKIELSDIDRQKLAAFMADLGDDTNVQEDENEAQAFQDETL